MLFHKYIFANVTIYNFYIYIIYFRATVYFISHCLLNLNNDLNFVYMRFQTSYLFVCLSTCLQLPFQSLFFYSQCSEKNILHLFISLPFSLFLSLYLSSFHSLSISLLFCIYRVLYLIIDYREYLICRRIISNDS